MEKKMETTILSYMETTTMGYIGTTTRIHSFIPDCILHSLLGRRIDSKQ